MWRDSAGFFRGIPCEKEFASNPVSTVKFGFQPSHMNNATEPQYIIPARFRKMENMHIVFWILKDISWCLNWKVLGILMIFPTLIISIIIAWRTRKMLSELAHNLAVSFWITANALWMIAEFFSFDEMHIWRQFEGRHLALIPFFIGVVILANYYLIQKPKESRGPQVATL